MRLAVDAPFHLEATVRVLQRRPSNLIDTWNRQHYRRVIRVREQLVLIDVENRGTIDSPDVRLATRPLSNDRSIERKETARVASAILGLGADAAPAQRLAEREPALRATAGALRGMRAPHYPDLFETFANVIPFQQLSLEAGMAVVARLIQLFGKRLSDGSHTHFAFPVAGDIADAGIAHLKGCGLSRHKSLALHTAARAIASGTLTLTALEQLPSPQAIDRLLELPGIGPWSAALILLRGLGRVDVFPQADTGAESSLMKLMHLRSRGALARVAARFGEYRGYLYFYGLASRLLAAGLIGPASPPAMRQIRISAPTRRAQTLPCGKRREHEP